MPKRLHRNKIPTTVYLTKGQIQGCDFVRSRDGIPLAVVVRRGLVKELLKKSLPTKLEEVLKDEAS